MVKWNRMTWVAKVDEDGVLKFPDELIAQMNWKEGDVLEWIDNDDGSFSLRKYEWECSTQSDAPMILDQDT